MSTWYICWFNSPSIIYYLEPLTGDVFTVRFADCHFDENVFLPLERGNSIPKEWQDITWYVSSLSHLDPHTRQCELIKDIKKVIKLHILAVNTSTHINVPKEQLENVITSESKTRLKRGKPIS